jgi:hypothetical protein
MTLSCVSIKIHSVGTQFVNKHNSFIARCCRVSILLAGYLMEFELGVSPKMNLSQRNAEAYRRKAVVIYFYPTLDISERHYERC